MKTRPVTTNPTPDTWGLLSYSLLGCQLVGLTATPASPEPLGTHITLTATPPIGGCGAPLYQFWYYGPGGPWKMVKDFGSPNPNTFPWDTTGVAPGTYAWVVYIRETGETSGYDSFALLSVTVG